MTALFEQTRLHFESLSSREQWLIAIGGWLAVLGIGFNLFLSPQQETLKQVLYQQIESRESILEQGIFNQSKEETLSISPDLRLEEQLALLKIDLQDADESLESKVGGLVSAADMASLMEVVLMKSEQLILLSMQSLPSIQLASTEDKRYYIHPVEMKLKGRYFDIVNYLSGLEALSIKYYWRSLDYRVIGYPSAEVTINVYTLGESPVFIGGARDAEN